VYETHDWLSTSWKWRNDTPRPIVLPGNLKAFSYGVHRSILPTQYFLLPHLPPIFPNEIVTEQGPFIKMVEHDYSSYTEDESHEDQILRAVLAKKGHKARKEGAAMEENFRP